ncbi:hypothetical protein CBS115989_6503 [Aspergillus niger]|nr:hypothetical protein CBS115989_6503 [Aspergillus niger]KAI2844030.1 hypothetical protein CBS11232_8084 [Aspergillus niger]KAI2876773.1 hypothetical protein CBS115988_4311 [Aspergillus niger]KAI2898180.1 hypothetical protein CBS13152_2959 [Aspergillus niger]KAI2929532.1 hypothetical protein CBS147320_3865 [Aspergillus niger]
MGESAQRQSSGLGSVWKHLSWALLTVQCTSFVLLLHYSRIMSPAGGKRYLTSTTVFFNEVVKLAISLTMALYEVSKTAPPSVPATSLFFSLTTAIFSGDSWKLAIPACLYTLANSLQYIALSNLPPATFQASYQLKLIVVAIASLVLLKRPVSLRKLGLMVLLLAGVALVQMPTGNPDDMTLQDETARLAFPRSLEEWKASKLGRESLHKRSATYEGIEEDMMTANPRLNATVGLLATVGACLASGVASVYFEKVLKDSAKSTSLWIRNVQLSVYSIFPALFIGVVFLDGEKVAANGFFEGYNWIVWSTVVVQAIGGIATSFYIGYAFRDGKNMAMAASIVLTTVASVWLFEFELTANYLLGSFAVLVVTCLCEDANSASAQAKRQTFRPPPIRVDRYEKESKSGDASPASPSPNEISIKLPELDAFDLELLARLDEQVQSPYTVGSVADRGSLSRPSQRTDYNRVSRFFQAGPHATPRQSFGSSSPDTGVGSPSSPLTRRRAGRLEAHAPEHDFEDNIDPHNFSNSYKTDSNIVLAAPTGSGKTAIMELAICRLLNCLKDERFKVIYQAPTKSLCSEKFRDWSRKFNTLGLQCAELTGDTDHTQLRSVQNSQVIITTPEKWDSMTRKWKDHARLMQLVRLFLIDEVHILKEARGATLEAVVSRMKANGSNVRFVALSATVPNSEDIATWIEIGLGNITDIESAIRWLAGTFFFVRMRRNPTYYRLKEDADREDEEEMLRQICQKDIKLLQDCGLVSADCLKSTKFGDAMARYYLSVISRADEFREIRLKAGEKSLYKEINRSNAIRFPVNVDIAISAHKISLLIQSELGAVDLPDGEPFQKHRFTFKQDKTFVFSHINRLIRCIIDCQVGLEDSITLRNALELARSFGAKVWDDSPLQMKQIEQIGVVAVRKLASSGITSIETLEACEPHQIDMILSRNPPFGRKLLERLMDFPKLRVSVKMIGKGSKTGTGVQINIRSEVAFMNEKCPTYFQRRPVYVCFMAETSDGRLLDFRRVSACKMPKGQDIVFSAELKSADQSVTCYAMCDDIAGTMRSAQLRHDIPASLFPSQRESPSDSVSARPKSNISRRRSNDTSQTKFIARNIDLWDSDDLFFGDFLDNDQAEKWSFVDKLPEPPVDKVQYLRNTSEDPIESNHQTVEAAEAVRLDNGRWACNHRCKDKTRCKHFCCRDGLEKPPKANKKRSGDDDKDKGKKTRELNQKTLPATIAKKETTTQASNPSNSEAYRHRIESPVSTHKASSGNTETNNNNNKPEIGSSCPAPKNLLESSSDYGNDSFSDFPSPSALLLGKPLVATSSKDQNLAPPTTEDNMKIDMTTEDWSDNDGWHNYQLPPVVDMVSTPKASQEKSIQPPQGSGKADIINSTATEINEMISNEQDDTPNCRKATPADSHGKKRKVLLTTTAEDNRKRCKRNKDIVSTRPSSFQPSGTTDEGAGVPASWEEIDPAILHEFKDIINLF